MEQKSNSTMSSINIPDALSGESSVDRTPDSKSSAIVRKDLGWVMGNVPDASGSLKDSWASKLQEVKDNILDGTQDAKKDVARVADNVQQTGKKKIEATSASAKR